MSEYRQEIAQAIAAADDALYHLKQAQECLDSASNWGIVDILGGGMLATMLKRRKMRGAQAELESARVAVQHFADELNDVEAIVGTELEIDDFLGFADYFFDGVFADWMVQSKISKARDQVERGIAHVSQIREGLIKAQEAGAQA